MSTPKSEAQSIIQIPKVAIKFCTQCKWNLRAAYYAQELLQTFSTTIGEVSLLPSMGGIFTITLYHFNGRLSTSSRTSDSLTPTSHDDDADYKLRETLIWDRKRDTGFPETKELKNRIRNIIDPARDMGHIDRSLKRKSVSLDSTQEGSPTTRAFTTGSLDIGEAIARGAVERENSGGSTAARSDSLHLGTLLSLSRETSAISASAPATETPSTSRDPVKAPLSNKEDCEDCK